MALDPDPYRTLGLTRGASLDEVKRAYRRLAKVNHPDAAGPAALPRFLAIQAAYEQLVGLPGSAGPGGRGGPAARRGPSAADPDRADATRRAYGGRPREARPGAGPAAGARPGADSTTGARPGADSTAGGRPGAGPTGARPGARRPFTGSRPGGTGAGRAGRAEPGEAANQPGARRRTPDDATATDTGATGARPGRGKATLGSTSYDGADAGPVEPDWGGASWYGTTSGTYWTINPKEYADPRKHGPEYQARARRAAGAPGEPSDRRSGASDSPSGSPSHTTRTWWESTAAGPNSGPDDSQPNGSAWPGGADGAGFAGKTGPTGETGPAGHAPPPNQADPYAFDEPAPDPARAAIDLGRALTDPRSGGLRGRAVRAVLAWLPIALGLSWLVGELSGCGRFAATCDPAVGPLTTVGQGILLAVLFLLPDVAAIAAGAALVLLAAATGASLILSATGSAADEDARRAALAVLLLIAWLGGLGIALVRRVRSGHRPSRPVS